MNSPKAFWQTSLALTFAANLAILAFSWARWQEIGVILHRSVWGLALLLYLAVIFGSLFLWRWMEKSPRAPALLNWLEQNPRPAALWIPLGGILFAGIILLLPWLKFTWRVGEVVKKSTQDPVLTTILFYWLAWWVLLLAAGALKVALRTRWQAGFAAAALGMGLAYEVYNRLQAVTNYPFSLGWSETSRYFYASLFFADSLYGQAMPLSTLHPTRYFLQSLAFLFPSWGLVEHRAWQVFLWLFLTGLTAWALVRRFQSAERQPGYPTPFLVIFFFLYFLRVGIYYHLLPMLLLPLWLVSARHPWRSLAAVIAASLWAGVSRVNWFPVPAMLAIALYLLEEPLAGRKWTDYLHLPTLWGGAGLVSALAAQAAYIPLSGNAANAGAFASSFTSDLLWYRLFPNELYPLGVLGGILLVSAPLLIVAFRAPLRRGETLSRWLLWLMLAILFLGGLVVSVKIGGGGDLHNMDAFAALLGLVAMFGLGSQNQPGKTEHQKQVLPGWGWVAAALILPLAFSIPALKPRPSYLPDWNNANLAQLKTLVEGTAGETLFINERHLVTFGEIDVPMVAEYENVFLMEMAMSGNEKALEQFYEDLRSHRFGLIVAGKQNVGIKEEGAFAEENNAWNTRISPFILCYYEPITLLEPDRSRIEVFAPRALPGVCP